MTRLAALLSGAFLVVAGGVGGWSLRSLTAPAAPEPSGEADEADAPAVEPADMRVEVQTAPVTSGSLPLVVAAIGVVKTDPAATYTLSLRAGGRVVSTRLAPGRSVTRGEVLLELDPAPLEAALLEARAAAAQAAGLLEEFDGSGRERQRVELEVAGQRARAEGELAEANLSRLEALQKQSLVADKALAEARQAVARARQDRQMAERALEVFLAAGGDRQRATLVANRDATQAARQQAEGVLADAVLRAPADGQVVAAAVAPGDRVEPGASLGTLLLAQGRVLAFAVAASAACCLSLEAPVSWVGPDGSRQEGRVRSIAGGVEASSGLIEVRVAPDPTAAQLSPGLVVRGEIERGRLDAALLVPDRAVVRSGDHLAVVVAGADGVTHVRPVVVRGHHRGLTAVEGELAATDRVVVEGGYNLPDGAHVVEKAPAPPAEAPPGAAGGGGR